MLSCDGGGAGGEIGYMFETWHRRCAVGAGCRGRLVVITEDLATEQPPAQVL